MKATITLAPENIPIYENMCKQIAETGLTIVEHATGGGKTYIAGKYIEEHPGRALVVKYMNAMENSWRLMDGWEAISDKVDFMTVQKLSKQSVNDIVENYDTLVLDEAHHYDTPVYGKIVHDLIDSKQINVIGLSGTPQRYIDGKDVRETLFIGNVTKGASTSEMIRDGRLPKITYVCALYDLNGIYNHYKEAGVSDTLLKKLQYTMAQTDSISKILQDNISNTTRKGIVFVDDIDAIESGKEIIKTAFENDPIYSIHSKMSKRKVDCNIDEFNRCTTGWLVAVNMANEALHLNNISIIIMLRKTASHIIYKQQLGRALSRNRTDSIVFDLVGNHRSVKALAGKFIPSNSEFERDFETTSWQNITKDYTRDILEVLGEIESKLAVYKEYTREEDQFIIDNYVKNGAKYCADQLGRSITSIRSHAHRLGLYGRACNQYTPEDDQFIIDNYVKNGAKYCADQLGRTRNSIKGHARMLGLHIINYFTEDEDQFIRDNYVKNGPQYCADQLGRSLGSIKSRAFYLRATIRKMFTEDEDQFIRDNYNVKGAKYCGAQLGRPASGVIARAKKLGLPINKKLFTEDEDQFIRDNYKENGAKYCADQLGRSAESIISRASFIGVGCKTRYTPEDDQFLRDNYIKNGSKYCADRLGRTRISINTRARALGLAKSRKKKEPST